MKLVALSELFCVTYGVNLELNRMTGNSNGVPFVGRSDRHNGVTARVSLVPGIDPNPAGTLSVAGGGSVLATFLQKEPYYSGRDLFYLTPQVEMTDSQKLYYCACIRANRYRYSYGRQANKTLRNLNLPDIRSLPAWVKEGKPHEFEGSEAPAQPAALINLDTSKWRSFSYQELFDISRGDAFYIKDSMAGPYPYVSATASANGVTTYTERFNNSAKKITVSYDGSIGEAFFQPTDFFASEKIAVLSPKEFWCDKLTTAVGLFICALIRREKFKYTYGRKWSIESRMKTSTIRLPVDAASKPDWLYMQSYIESLPFSSQVT